jgi:hypothetical protein
MLEEERACLSTLMVACRVVKAQKELAAVQQELLISQEHVRKEHEEKLNLIAACQTKEAQLRSMLQSYEVCVCVCV